MRFFIHLETLPGTSILSAGLESHRIANQLQVGVKFKFNDIECVMLPSGSAERLTAMYEDASENGSKHIVCGGP